MATLDFWFDFASTYSYPTATRIGALAAAAGVEVRFRPFLLGPIFKAQGWDTSPFNVYPAKGRHMWRDLERTCEALKLAFRRPEPFPQPSLLAARVALALEGEARVRFSRGVFRAEFGEGRSIGDRETLSAILKDCGVEADAAFARAESPANKEALKAQNARAAELGLPGAPSLVTAEGEVFWGNDRLEQGLDWAIGKLR